MAAKAKKSETQQFYNEVDVQSFTGKKKIRRSFQKIREVLSIPNLINVQTDSYNDFLYGDRAGLNAVLKSCFPINAFAGKAVLDYVSYEFEEPKYDEEECITRDLTYSAPLRVTLRLSVFDIDEDTGLKSIRDIKEQDVYLVDMPMMTGRGTFIVNGTERVVVSQMHRSPGVFFDHDGGKTHASGKYLFSARVIPYRGSWLDFEYDAKDILNCRIDRRRKLPVTTFLRAIDSSETEAAKAKAAEKGEEVNPLLVQEMSNEEILATFYETSVYTKDKKGWKAPFDGNRYRGTKLTEDLVNAKTGKAVAESGEKMTPRKIKKLEEEGLKDILVAEENILGSYLAIDLFDEKTGEVIAEAGDEISEDLLKTMADRGTKEIPLLAIDHINTSAHLRNTLVADKCSTREEALCALGQFRK